MVNLPHVGDVSFTPSVRAPGRSAEPRGVSSSSGAAPGQGAASASAARAGDTVELSSAARSAGERPIRADLVDRVRRQIADGTYESEDKLDVVARKIARVLNLEA